MAFGSKFAGIEVKIGADTSRLGRDMKKADSIVGRFSHAAANSLKLVGVAAAGAAIKIGVDGVKAYIEDENAARKLATTLENVTNAKKEQIASVEEFITKTMFATGVADDQLRPAMARLLRSTQDITKSQKLLNIALDVSSGTGKSLDTVVAAIGKGYDGNNASLGRLGLGIDSAKLKSGKFSDIMQQLRHDFQGFAEADANTMEGKLKRLNLRWQETKEQIGAVILEGLEPLMDWFETPEGTKAMNDFFEGMVSTFKTLAKVIPPIVEEFGKFMKKAEEMGTVKALLSDPKLMAAATAYGVGMVSGGPFVAKVAALSAYTLASDFQSLEGSPGNNNQAAAREIDKALKGALPDLTTREGMKKWNQQFNETMTPSRQLWNQFAGATGFEETRQITNNSPIVNITINRAIDPKQTAMNVQRALAKATRMGFNPDFVGKGLGN